MNPDTTAPASPSNSTKHRQLISVKRILFIFGFLFLFLILFFGYFLWPSNKKAISSDPTINAPFFDFTGEIKQVNGNTLNVEGDIVRYLETDGKTPVVPTLEKKTLTVQVNPETIITLSPVVIPYSLKMATPSAETRIKVVDLKVNQKIKVVLKEDLKSLKKDEVESISILVLPGLTFTTGKVTTISDTNITIAVSPPAVAQEKQYTFKVGSQTEIVELNVRLTLNKTSSPSKLALGSIKVGDNVTVYSDRDLDINSELEALKIDKITDAPIKADPDPVPVPSTNP